MLRDSGHHLFLFYQHHPELYSCQLSHARCPLCQLGAVLPICVTSEATIAVIVLNPQGDRDREPVNYGQ